MDGGSAHSKASTYTEKRRHISVPRVEFEPTILVSGQNNTVHASTLCSVFIIIIIISILIIIRPIIILLNNNYNKFQIIVTFDMLNSHFFADKFNKS
jgi:hypothetical protein